jgi:hypothetical protein
LDNGLYIPRAGHQGDDLAVVRADAGHASRAGHRGRQAHVAHGAVVLGREAPGQPAADRDACRSVVPGDEHTADQQDNGRAWRVGHQGRQVGVVREVAVPEV